MDQILLGLGAAGALLLVIAIVVALWEQRRHMAEMRQHLAHTENTRDLLQAHAKDVDARLAMLAAAVHQQSAAAAAPPVLPKTSGRSGLDQTAAAGLAGHVLAGPAALARLSSAPAARSRAESAPEAAHMTTDVSTAAVGLAAAPWALAPQWIETEPMVLTAQVPDFDPTMPAELSDH